MISVLMQNPERLDDAVSMGVVRETFYVPAHGSLFDIIRHEYEKNRSFDLIGVTSRLKAQDRLDNFGGPSGITKLYSFTPTEASFEHHCGLILEAFRLRKVISVCMDYAAKAYDAPDNADELLDSFEHEVFSIQRSAQQDSIQDSKTLFQNTLKNLERFIKGEVEVEGLPTRFKIYNDLTKGFKKSEMTIIAARPSVGKTALMCNLVEDFAMSKIPGLVFSLEMSAQQLADRIFYGRAQFPAHFLKAGFSPTKDELRRLMEAAQDLMDKNLFIDDTPAISVDQLRAKTRRMKRKHNIQYFAVDYLQLMRGCRKFENREREVAEISSGLKALCKELEIPGIVLAQINRSSEKRSDGEPKMSDLRESGAIEQDADVITLLHRSSRKEKKKYGFAEKREYEFSSIPVSLLIAKNRNGPTGTVETQFLKEIMQFK